MDDRPEIPITREWVGTLVLGYFIGGPVLMLLLLGIAKLIAWVFP